MTKIFLLSVVILFSFARFTYSQNKPVGNITETRNISPTGEVKTNSDFYNESPETNELIKNIFHAKKNGDTEKARYYQNKLDALTGTSKIECSKLQFTEGNNTGTDVLNYNTVATGFIAAASVAVDRLNGNIYVVTIDAFTPIVIKIYKSVNNGLTFSPLNNIVLSSPENQYVEPNQIDLEVVSNGTTSYLYGVLGLWASDSTKAMYFRVKSDGTSFTNEIFARTKRISNPAGVENIMPRITSDNAMFSQVPYVYITYTLDSLRGSGNKWMKTKVARINNPLEFSPSIKILYPLGSINASYFYTAINQPDSAFMQSDICCVGTGDTSFLVTTTVIRGATTFSGTNFYTTTSNGFGNTISSSSSVNDSKLLTLPRIASPGYITRNVMMGAVRLYGGGDWDPYYYKSNNFNRNYNGFMISGYVDNSADTTTSIDLAARNNSFDNFLFVINNKKTVQTSTGIGKILGNLYTNGSFSGLYQANPPSFQVQYSTNYPSAAFRFVNNDSCFIGYGGLFSIGANFINYGVTGGCSGAFIGIQQNSSTVSEFNLAQNYPNPFNPTTSITFDMLKGDFVTIKLYNILGKEVENLVSEYKQAGSYVISYDAGKLESGIYFYKMETKDYSMVRKMILMK